MPKAPGQPGALKRKIFACQTKKTEHMTYSYANMPLPFFGLLLICDIPLRRPRAGPEHLKMCKAKVFMEDSGVLYS